jgi:uncharacterized protein YbaR (Trm112 family)
MKIDLGCGGTKETASIGVDIVPLEGVDVIASLTERPYPFANNSFEAIYLKNMIEHLPDTIGTMEELHRMARPDGRVFITVVNWNSHYAAMDPQHVRLFTENSFDFFGKRVGRSYYTKARFEVERVDLYYDPLAQRVLRSKRLLRFLSFYLCNILQGLSFELRAIKDTKAESHDAPENVFAALRCPECLAKAKRLADGTDRGQLRLFKENWLVCQDSECGRKYPVYDGLPVMLIEQAERWRDVALQDLPAVPPGDFSRIALEEPSIGSDDGGMTELERMNRDWRLKKPHVIAALFVIGTTIGFLISRLWR